MAASMEHSKDPYEMGFLIAPRVPQGLAAVVESLTREVLRQRPEDIYVFAAHHFEKLLTLRERYDVGKAAAASDYNFYNTIRKRDEREKESRKSKRTTADIGTSSGWSLNETAKVLERHRNIFGDGEKRISTEEVRELANEKNGRSGGKGKREKRRSSNGAQEYTKDPTRRTTTENNDSARLDRSAKTLKIISQIPTVLTRNSGTKDIKMELRKNRLGGSLREKSTDSSNESQLAERTGEVSRKSLGKAERAELIEKFEEGRISKKTIRRSGSAERNSGQSGRTRRRKGSFSELLLDRNELTKARSMDRVKDYVVRTFALTKNVDELDLDYVERVQDIIDRNVPIIKDKLEDLKSDVLFQTSKRRENQMEIDNRAIDRSTSNVERPRKRGSRPNTSESDSRRSVENRESYRSKRSSSVDSTTSRRQQDDTLEARLTNTQSILEDISSICYPKSRSVAHRSRSRSRNGRSNEQENGHSTSEGDSNITLPAVRPSSSKSSRSLSRNESDNLILPPISPDTGKVPKKKNDTTLPTLSSMQAEALSSSSSLPGDEKETDSVNRESGDLGKEILELSTSIKEDISSTRKMLEGVNDALKTTMTSDEKDKVDEERSSTRDTTNGKERDLLEETSEKPREVLDRKLLEVSNVEEVFKDSLNVTPDIIDIPQRPDSLEPRLDEERPTTADSHLSTVDEGAELKRKLMETREMERNVEKAITSFDDSIKKEEIKNAESVTIVAAIAAENNDTKATEDLTVAESKESRETPDTDHLKEESPKDVTKSIDATNEDADRSRDKPKSESNDVDEATKNAETEKSEISINSKSGSEMVDTEETPGTRGDREVDSVQKDSPSSSKGGEEEEEGEKDSSRISLPPSPKEVPFSYILTEGSPVEIPEFVTTVIIPDRPPSTPELDFESKEDVELREERRQRAVESFGEYIRPMEPMECSTVDIDFIRGIKAGHDIAIVRQDLDGIREEEEDNEDNEDNEEKGTKEADEVFKNEITRDRTPVLEHISENEEIEDNDESNKSEARIVAVEQEDDTEAKEIVVIDVENAIDNNRHDATENANIVENSLEGEESTETADVTSDSTNEVKETTITDRSSDGSSLDPARPIVPELNLDSLRDITVSSFKINDADATVSLTEPMSSSGKEKLDVDQNPETRQEENSDSGQKEEDTSAMETISTDEKSVEVGLLEVKVLTDLKTEEMNKEEIVTVPTGYEKIIEKDKEGERLVNSDEKRAEPVLPENVEEGDTIKSVTVSPNYLGLEENATELDTEEEIAKELIEIDRAENPPVSQETRTKSQEIILDSNGASGNREEVTTSAETNTREDVGKREEEATSPKVTGSFFTTTVENLQETASTKDNEEEIISGGVESRRSSGNEEGKDQSNGSPEDDERPETSVTAFERKEVKECGVDTELGEKKEYRVYVTDLGQTESQEDDTKGSSTTFHSAATKIQAGVRGFLTRRRLRGINRQGSTLDGIPSIKESFANEPPDVKSKSETASDSPFDAVDASTARSEKVTGAEKKNIPLARTVPTPAKSRQCLRREDAMQRNTLSTGNAFASSRVQHTGEFHDCLPLPVLESIEIPRNSTGLPQDEDDDEGSVEEPIERQAEDGKKIEGSPIDSPTNLTAEESKEQSSYETIENIDPTPADFVQDLNNLLGGLHPKDFAKLLTGQAGTPIVVGLIDVAPDSVLGTSSNVIFEGNANLNVTDDDGRGGAVKDESTLQNRYLNFITSVEDNEPSHVKDTAQVYKDRSNDHGMQSLREPLALPGTPEGIVIEELGSLDGTTLSKLRSDLSFDPTSLESSMMDRESTELSEKSNDEDVEIPATLRAKETEVDDRRKVAKESLSSTSAKTVESTLSNESDERSGSSKSQREDKVENEGVAVEAEGDRISEDDKDNDKNEEVIKLPLAKKDDTDQDTEPGSEIKKESKDKQISEDDNDNKIKEILPSETKEADSDKNANVRSEDKEDNKDKDLDRSNEEKVDVKRSTVEKIE